MRILIVGGGIAGLALAALLRRQGRSPLVIERGSASADLGYGIALWPHGTRVLHALDAYEGFVSRREPMARYTLRDGRGRVVGSFETPAAIERFGHLGVIPRAALIQLLEDALDGVEVRHGVSIEALSPADDHVDVRLTDGDRASFDLVVGADGAHSRVRERLLGRIPDRDTGWGCYVWWADSALAARGETTEWWGAGRFLGTYPCRERLCAIAGGPMEVLQPTARSSQSQQLKALLAPLGVAVDRLLERLSDSERLYLWHMADVRSPRWVRGRIVLVGDAAAAFLPTAGIGASMALESAAVLADELSRTDAAHQMVGPLIRQLDTPI